MHFLNACGIIQAINWDGDIVEKINLEETFQELLRVMIANNKGLSGDIYDKYAAIYMAPASNVIGAVNLLDTSNIYTALVVGASGGYIFELLLHGVKRIDAFDINVNQYLFYKLLEVAIKTLDYNTFINTFCAQKKDRGQIFSCTLNTPSILPLIFKLDGQVGKFWHDLLMITNNNLRSLFKTNFFRTDYKLFPEYLEKYSSVYNRNSYNELQRILKNNNYTINYEICSIEDIANIFNGKKYDVVIWDNILQYFRTIPSLDEVSRVNSFVKKDISNMLNLGGIIQVDYGFEVASHAVSKLIGRTPPNLSVNDVFSLEKNSAIINREKREGIIPGLISKYEDYYYEFIPGVEEELSIGHHAENVVLSYIKKR